MSSLRSIVVLAAALFVAWRQFGSRSLLREKLEAEYDYLVGTETFASTG